MISELTATGRSEQEKPWWQIETVMYGHVAEQLF